MKENKNTPTPAYMLCKDEAKKKSMPMQSTPNGIHCKLFLQLFFLFLFGFLHIVFIERRNNETC